MSKKKRYIDDDTRAELSQLKNLQFESEEDLELKLEEIQRKKNNRSVSRIIRIFGFVFLLIIFITSCDVFYEGTIFGSFGDSRAEHSAVKWYFGEQNPILLQNAYEGDIDAGKYVGTYKNITYVDTQTNIETTVLKMDAHEYKLMFTTNSTYRLIEPGTFEAGWFMTTYYPEVDPVTQNVYTRSLRVYIDRDQIETLKATFGPDFEFEIAASNGVGTRTDYIDRLYDDTFMLGEGMITILFSIDLICLAAAIVYLSIFIVRDIIDVIKNTFGTAVNIAGNTTDAIKENLNFSKRKSNADDEEEKPKSRKLFDDEGEDTQEDTKPMEPERRKDDDTPTKPYEEISSEDLDNLLTSN